MKHPEHICRFNDGESTCECFDSGYDQALQADQERLVCDDRVMLVQSLKQLERPTVLYELTDAEYDKAIEYNRAIDDAINLIQRPPSN